MRNKFIKYFFVLLALPILLQIHTAFATCSDSGFTVIYVNGIFTPNKKDADTDTFNLKTDFNQRLDVPNVQFITGYNPSHLAGAGDLIESASQLLGSSINNYDFNTILLQIHPEVTTRKILFVGHSQGTFYTNEIYNYLLAHGEQKESTAVYNVATPANFVAGRDSAELVAGGAYLTSQNDKVINLVRKLAPAKDQPLPANVDIPLSAAEAADKFGGHSFNDVYLTHAPERIVSDIGEALGKLTCGEQCRTTATDSILQSDSGQAGSPQAGCFIPPDRDLSYRATEAIFAVADPVAGGIAVSGGAVLTAGEFAYDAIRQTAIAIGQAANAALASANKFFTAGFGKTGAATLAVFDKFLLAVGPDVPGSPTPQADSPQPTPDSTATPSSPANSAGSAKSAATTTTTASNATIFPGSTATITYSSGGGNSPMIVSDISLATALAATSATTEVSTTTASSTATTTTATDASTTSTSTDAVGTASSSDSVSTTTVIFSQLVETGVSQASDYSNNWYRLGRGLSGVLWSLTLHGYINDGSFLASHVWLKEFEDSGYSRNLIRTITISDAAPFTATPATARFENLAVELNPFSYYRLDTYQDYQNRSVILSGSNTTGTAMSNDFISGRAGTLYPFYPFLIFEGNRATSSVDISLPQPPTTPGNFYTNFDALNSTLGLGWASSTDLDSMDEDLTYELGYSTSSALSADTWQSVGKNLRTRTSVPVVFGNTYKFGVRAVDDGGLRSEPALTDWSFPPGFTQYTLSNPLNSAGQNFVAPNDGLLQSIQVFTRDFATESANPEGNICSVDLYEIADASTALIATSDTPNPRDGSSYEYAYRGYLCEGVLNFTYNAHPQILSGHHYRWAFHFSGGFGSVKFFGRSSDTAGGAFSDATITNAKFILTADTGVLFQN